MVASPTRPYLPQDLDIEALIGGQRSLFVLDLPERRGLHEAVEILMVTSQPCYGSAPLLLDGSPPVEMWNGNLHAIGGQGLTVVGEIPLIFQGLFRNPQRECEGWMRLCRQMRV